MWTATEWKTSEKQEENMFKTKFMCNIDMSQTYASLNLGQKCHHPSSILSKVWISHTNSLYDISHRERICTTGKSKNINYHEHIYIYFISRLWGGTSTSTIEYFSTQNVLRRGNSFLKLLWRNTEPLQGRLLITLFCIFKMLRFLLNRRLEILKPQS